MRRVTPAALAAALVAAALVLVAHAAAIAPFFFIQVTDPQFGMAANNAGFEQETANLEFAVATANPRRVKISWQREGGISIPAIAWTRA